MISFRNLILLMLAVSVVFSCKNEPAEPAEAVKSEQTEKAVKKGKNKKRKPKKKQPVKINAPESKVAAPQYPDTYPLYPGCTEKAYEARKRCAQQRMINDVVALMKYPQSAVDNNVNGVVVHSFIIEADGTMSDLRLDKSLTPECDMAAKQAIEDLMKHSGPWEPGTLDGKNQPVRYTLPLSFKNTPKDKNS